MKEDRGERKMDESEGTEEIVTFPLYPYLCKGQQTLPSCKPISVGRPGDARYTTPLPHPTNPDRRMDSQRKHNIPTFSMVGYAKGLQLSKAHICKHRTHRSACTSAEPNQPRANSWPIMLYCSFIFFHIL